MEITTKGRYAVRVMADIARNNDKYVSLNDVAVRQEISLKYLEKIVSMLSKAKLLESMRGATGGYKLTKEPYQISIKEILDATGDSVKVATCVEELECPKANICDTVGVWSTLNALINNYLENITLKDLIENTCARKITK